MRPGVPPESQGQREEGARSFLKCQGLPQQQESTTLQHTQRGTLWTFCAPAPTSHACKGTFHGLSLTKPESQTNPWRIPPPPCRLGRPGGAAGRAGWAWRGGRRWKLAGADPRRPHSIVVFGVLDRECTDCTCCTCRRTQGRQLCKHCSLTPLDVRMCTS